MSSRAVLALLAAFLIAGCGSGGPPEITFAAGAATTVATPTQYCEDDFLTCTNDPAAPVDLAVPAGTPLVVGVPEAVQETPWQLVYTYRDGAGEQVDERSTVLVDQPGYTLELPPDARLITAQVQQYGPPPVVDPESGEVEFPTRSSWVLLAS